MAQLPHILSDFSRAAGFALLLVVGGCATVAPAPSGDAADARNASRSRAERVFLYQSRVADALLDRYPLMEIFAGADPALVAAEERMTETCSPLTRAVLAKLEGQKPSLGLRFKVLTSIDECERAARRIDRLLQQNTHATASVGTI